MLQSTRGRAVRFLHLRVACLALAACTGGGDATAGAPSGHASTGAASTGGPGSGAASTGGPSSGGASSGSPGTGGSTSADLSGGPAAPASPGRPPHAGALPAGSRASLRDTSSPGPFVDGAALEIRTLIREVTANDALGIAARVRPVTLPKKAWQPGWPDPFDRGSYDWTQVRSTLSVEVKGPDATHTLELADPAGPPYGWAPRPFGQAFTIDGTAFTMRGVRLPWKTPVPGLLATPGTYVVTVSFRLELGDKPVALRSGPLTFTVVPPTDPRRPLVDLERAASEAARARAGVSGLPAPSDPTVEDVEGNLVVRFHMRFAGPENRGPDDDIVEVWLDPTGKILAVDPYRHWSCIAAGTPIATPNGPVPIEALGIGAEVDAYDVVTGIRTVAAVLRSDASHAEVVRQMGALRATPEHPVWAGGAWVPLGEVSAGVTLLGVDLAPTAAAEPVLEGPATVHDLTVSSPNTYFAGGVLVHNKMQSRPLGGGRPWGRLFYRNAAKP